MRTCIAAFLVLSAGPGILSAQIDANGNGISDIYERHFNGGQLFGPTFTAMADQDADGQNNLQESISGTDPLKFDPPEGHLVQTIRHVPATWWQEPGQNEPVLLSPEAFEIGWQAVAGKQYKLSFSPTLEGGSWLPVGGLIYRSVGGPVLVGCIPDAGGGQMPDKFFWRVEASDVDQDDDGLNAYEEILFGTDPWSPVTFSGIPDLWLTSHYPSAQGFDPGADEDNDGLTNFDEYFQGASPHNADSDGDGTMDGTEVNQGSNPTNNSDGGLPPEDPLEEVAFTVGGDYSFWRMEIQGQGPRDTRLLRFASPATNQPVARTFKLQRNNKYEITLHRLGGEPDWYCWEATVGDLPGDETFDYGTFDFGLEERNENARFFSVAGHWLVDNRDGLLTSHLHSYYNDVATGLKATLLPMEYKLCWETLNKANQVFNKTKKDDSTENADAREQEGDATYAAPRNNLYVVADPADKLKVSLEFGLPEGLPERFIAAAYDANGKVPNSDALFPTTAGEPAAMEIPVGGITDTPREIKMGYDENNNSLLDDNEANRIPLYKRQSNNDLRHLNVKGISNGKYEDHKAALEGRIHFLGQDQPGFPAKHARSFLAMFHYNGQLNMIDEDIRPQPGQDEAINAFATGVGFAEWLTHNSGAAFSDVGVAEAIKNYEWAETSQVAEFFAQRSPFALETIVLNTQGGGFAEYATDTGTALKNFYNSQVKADAEAVLENTPDGVPVTFPQDGSWYHFPNPTSPNLFKSSSPQTTPGWVTPATMIVGKNDGHGGWGALITDFVAGTDEFNDFDAFGAVGRGRVISPRYKFTVRKDDVGIISESPVYTVTEVLFECVIEDLYDFNYEDSELSSHAAAMQIGYGKGENGEQRNHGRIYRHRILIQHVYPMPFDHISNQTPHP